MFKKGLIYVVAICVLLTFCVGACNIGVENGISVEDITVLQMTGTEGYKILTVADTHFTNEGSAEDASMFARFDVLVAETAPDLIIIDGDVTYDTNKRIAALTVLGNHMDTYEVPWTMVFGNHDTEKVGLITPVSSMEEFEMKREEQSQLLKTAFQYCVYQDTENLYGNGTTVYNIKNSTGEIVHSLFFFESGDYMREEDYEYDFVSEELEYTNIPVNYSFVHPEQIEWYSEMVDVIADGGEVINSSAFMHIPFPEYKTAWELYAAEGNNDTVQLIDGYLEDALSVSKVNSGLFTVMKEKNSTTNVFVGHDHANDFNLLYEGIHLNYIGGIKLITYPSVDDSVMLSLMGGRVLTIAEDGTVTNEKIYIDDIVE